MIEFPAITLWQPWASLLALGIKRHETRPQRLPLKHIGEWVAIHAAARAIRPAELGEDLAALCRAQWGFDFATALPHRSIVALAKFGPSKRTEDAQPGGKDAICGNFGPGRFAWPVLDIIELEPPIAATGSQGWWKVSLEQPGQLGEESNPTHGSLA